MGKLNIDLSKVLATEGGKKAILVVDDAAVARKTLAKNLEYYGFEVLEAASGIDGLQTYLKHKHKIALVLLDMVLSDVPGERVLAKLLELDPQVKVVACTESAASKVKQKAPQVIGALRKPISIDRLLKVLHLAGAGPKGDS